MAMSIMSSAQTSGSPSSAESVALHLERLPDDELAALASAWRAEALRGNKRARGHAHLCEVELRRRQGHVLGMSHQLDALDLRPLDRRGPPRPWWKFW